MSDHADQGSEKGPSTLGDRYRSALRPPTNGGLPAVQHGEAWKDRHWTSRVLHRVDEMTSRSGAGLAAGIAVIAWALVGLVVGFPDWWETALYSASSSVTLVVVFAIQHSSTRQQLSMQRKLDELLHALPGADDRVIAVEEAADHELERLAGQSLEHRERAGERTPG